MGGREREPGREREGGGAVKTKSTLRITVYAVYYTAGIMFAVFDFSR